MTWGPFPPLSFPLPLWQKPFKLLRVMEQRHLHGTEGHSASSEEDLERARRWLASSPSGRAIVVPDRRLLRSLLQIYEKQQEQERDLIEKAVLVSRVVSLRDLWTLWSQRGLVDRSKVATALAEELSRRASESPRFAERRVPDWVKFWGLSFDRMRTALEKTDDAIRLWCERKPVPLGDLRSSEGFVVTSPQIKHAVVTLIGSGSPDWWNRTTSARARQWVEGPGGDLLSSPDLDYVRAVADRQLQAAGGEAQRIEDFKMPPDAADLRAWVLRYLREPEESPANWHQMSGRSRAVFEWMMVLEQFDRILEEFRKTSSAYDRAAFWARYKGSLQDAFYMYLSDDDVAVCFMRLRDVLVVEFGTTANACYIYDAGPITKRLRALPLAKDFRRAGYLKSTHGLNLSGFSLRNLARLTHNGRWESRFQQRLAQLGLPPPPGRRY